MVETIRSVAVLGSSGTIGSLVGGLVAQMGIRAYFLSRTPAGARSGLERAMAQARSEVISRHIVCGDYDNLLESALKEADWIVECVTEDLAVKRSMYEKVDRCRRSDAIVSSTTSSLPLTELPKGRSESFRSNFLSTHFYNPPGKMLACEIASQPDTKPEVFDFMKDFLSKGLRREVVLVRNVAGFAGNRIAFLLFNRIAALAEEYGVEMIDYLIGPYTGRMMAPLATLDLVGLDIYRAIVESLCAHTADGMHESLIVPEYINRMIDAGCLGNKTPRKGGFYKRLESGKSVFLHPATCDYVPAIGPHLAFVEKAKNLVRLGMYQEAFDTIRTARCREADIVTHILCTYVAYSYSLIGEVTDPELGISAIDRVMSLGFNWAAPSVILRMLGGRRRLLELLEEKGVEVPETLESTSETPPQVPNAGKYFLAR